VTHATTSAAVDSWLGSGLGQAVLQAESELMTETLDDVFGWELLQVGTWGSGEQLLAGCRTRRHAVVLPHTLEFETDPYAVVREVDRVLAGEGQLIVLGFRPLSLWGFRSRAISRGYPPGLKRMIGARRIADWLELLGYDVSVTRKYLFTPPWGNSAPQAGQPSALLRRGFFNPWPAGAYLIKARKRVYSLTPIRPKMRERAPIGGLVKPTTPRQSN
jgi:hypothetical protein